MFRLTLHKFIKLIRKTAFQLTIAIPWTLTNVQSDSSHLPLRLRLHHLQLQ
jgi:hypothetical protein